MVLNRMLSCSVASRGDLPSPRCRCAMCTYGAVGACRAGRRVVRRGMLIFFDRDAYKVC